jgi:hypothetical protein
VKEGTAMKILEWLGLRPRKQDVTEHVVSKVQVYHYEEHMYGIGVLCNDTALEFADGGHVIVDGDQSLEYCKGCKVRVTRRSFGRPKVQRLW